MERKHRPGSGCLWFVIAAQFLVLLAAGLLVAGLLALGMPLRRPMQRHSVGRDEYPEMQEIWAWGAGQTKVVAVPLRGMILLNEEPGLFGSAVGTASMALKSIRRATHDPQVQAIILTVDSGGGGITASDVLYKALLEFKAAQEGRRVVALFGDAAASGAYYVCMAADRILAHPTSMTGSIGVVMQTLNLQELAQKIGVKDVTIKSGENKDLLNPLTAVSEKQRRMLQGIVDELHERFVTLVAEGRGLPRKTVANLGDGRVFSASHARDIGLVDELGYWQDAVNETARLLGVENVKVYRYEAEFTFSDLFRAAAGWNPLRSFWRRPRPIRLYYRWDP